MGPSEDARGTRPPHGSLTALTGGERGGKPTGYMTELWRIRAANIGKTINMLAEIIGEQGMDDPPDIGYAAADAIKHLTRVRAEIGWIVRNLEKEQARKEQ